MLCPGCQTANPSTARFCIACGLRLPAADAPTAATGQETPTAPISPPARAIREVESAVPTPVSLPSVSLSGSARKRRSSGARRALLAAVAVVIVLAAAGGGLTLYLRQQHSLRTGHWTALVRGVPGQSRPTPPAGAFQFTSLGGYVDYAPPRVAPIATSWTAYRNAQDGYTVDTASNWQASNTPLDGHAEWLLCPPGTDVSAQEPGPPPCVSYGWVAQHQMPDPADPSVGMEESITRDGVQGTLYTEAGMGASITAVFPHAGGFVYLTADGDADAAMYAFQHMLASLRFE